MTIEQQRLENLGPAERLVKLLTSFTDHLVHHLLFVTLTMLLIVAAVSLILLSCESHEKKVERCKARCHSHVLIDSQPTWIKMLCEPACNRDKDPDHAFASYPE